MKRTNNNLLTTLKIFMKSPNFIISKNAENISAIFKIYAIILM